MLRGRYWLRVAVTGLATGAVFVGSVWAGASLSPNPASDPAPQIGIPGIVGGEVVQTRLGVGDQVTLGPNELLAGASKVSIEPTPDAEAGEYWERDRAKCLPLSTSGFSPSGTAEHATDFRTPWVENNNCIYMGGFGIGPSQPVTEWDQEYGLWVRSAAFSRGGGANNTLVVTIIDGEGWFGEYNRLCGEVTCGIFDISDEMGTELGISPSSFIIASTHAHSGMDFIGGWGAVPAWYMDQVSLAIRQSIREAVTGMVPATLEGGEYMARGSNNERRDTYRSAEDPTVNWMRALDLQGNTISTVGTFAAHPTSFGSSATKAHADWPGVFDKTVESRFGGVGLMFVAGLGNMSSSGGFMMGKTIGDKVPAVGSGTPVPNPVVRTAHEFWNQPVTNVPLGTLGAGGFFDRPFSQIGATVSAGKSSAKPCRSASAVSARVKVTAAKIGSVVVTAAPGEIFANFSNTIEERSPITGLAIGQAGDALGYMPQSFETDHPARQGPGFAGGGVFEYEDAYSIDACFGDMALETQLKLLATL